MSIRNSHHILNTSSNLLGFCLVVLTSLKISKYDRLTMIDEFTGVACILLITSSVFSFLSIRSTSEKLMTYFENIADKFFIIALLLVFVITFMIAFSIIF
jgi:hypothetical protein